MTEKEFWTILGKINGWYRSENGTIRRKTRVRGKTYETCPVCAVANKKLRMNSYICEAWSAGASIKLDPEIIDKVASAADFKQSYARRKLLKLCK